MRGFRWLGLVSVLALTSCSGEEPPRPAAGRLRTQGGAVVLSRDERIAVVANRSAGVVTVFSLDPSLGAANMVTRTVEVSTGEGSEPWAAVIGSDDDTAYVVLRRSRQVVR
ncbi:MAG TPA: hypothetical protein VM686_35675, partial [Polyangiaceae bacterium]|nr:hypothetical protein [Polyangiaceae bacterium]